MTKSIRAFVYIGNWLKVLLEFIMGFEQINFWYNQESKAKDFHFDYRHCLGPTELLLTLTNNKQTCILYFSLSPANNFFFFFLLCKLHQ